MTKHIRADSFSALRDTIAVGRDSGLYVQPGGFHPLDPRMHDVGPAVWRERRDGKRGACWGMSKADMRRIADAINGALDGRCKQEVNDQPVELPFQAYPPGVTTKKLQKMVAKAEANGSAEPLADALSNLWRTAERSWPDGRRVPVALRRRRRPQRRVNIEAWVDGHPYSGFAGGFAVATTRGLQEQVMPGRVQFGRSNIEEDKGAITESYWPNGLQRWRWDRPRLLAVDPSVWEREYPELRELARLSVREGFILKMFARDPPASVADIARCLNIDAKAVRDSERIGLRRLAEARAKVGNLSVAPQPTVIHRLRPIGTVYAEWKCGELEKFWDGSRLAARWRSKDAHYSSHYSGERIDPERFLRQDDGDRVSISKPVLVEIATLLKRER
jgi:hypothetical protein